MEKYIRLFIIGLLLLSCDVTDDELILLEPTLELDGRLPMDGNGYYRLELNDSSNQTIHTISGTVGNTLYWDEPMKVEWESNLYWNFDDNIVSVTNCCSFSIMDLSIKLDSNAKGFEAAMCIDNCFPKVLTVSELSFVSNETITANFAKLSLTIVCKY